MRAGDALGDLLEERLLNLDELSGLDHVKDLLDLTQEHHLQNRTWILQLMPTGSQALQVIALRGVAIRMGHSFREILAT